MGMPYNTINYTSNFKKIIAVKLFHNFFLNGKFNFFDIKPNNETKRYLTNYGIIFRKDDNGFVLILNNDDKFASSTFKGDVTLCFQLEFKDDFFLNYTDIPYNNNQKLIFSNSYDVKLHKNEYVDNTSCHIDSNSGFSSDITLTINKNNEYFGYENTKSDLQEITYKVNFNTRDLIFRYNFITSKKELNGFFITNEEGSVKYNNFYKRILSSGLDVFCFNYKNNIKASEFYDIKLFLKKNQQGSLLSVFNLQLPHPEKNNISFDDDSKLFYADIFVNIN
tara:strand:+ start:333 stop:1169 length:837 start_codon:yes stop_codon:yes gene_type:complete